MTMKRMRFGSIYSPVEDTADSVLALGEWAVDTDTGQLKIGDGQTPFSQLETVSLGSFVDVDGGTL